MESLSSFPFEKIPSLTEPYSSILSPFYMGDIIKIVKQELKKIPLTKNVLIYSLHSKKYELTSPISVNLEYDGEQYIAYGVDLNLYGCGENENEALEDLRVAVVEFYENNRNKKLGNSLRKIQEYLSSIIKGKGI